MIKLENLIAEVKIAFGGKQESDHIFYQRIVRFLTERTGKHQVTSEGVSLYGSYQFTLGDRKIIVSFNNGRFTYLTSIHNNLTQTFNKDSFKKVD